MVENTFKENRVIISLGSNLGDRLNNIKSTIKKIKEKNIKILSISSIYETEPVDTLEDLKFLNCIISLSTPLNPYELLEVFQNIEKEMGRNRTHKNSPREIDIDILFFEDKIIETPNLIVPHPEIEKRKFVLIPLNEIHPEFKHPIIGSTIKEILKNCNERHGVLKILDKNDFTLNSLLQK